MPRSRRPACARCLRRTATSSPCRRERRFAISRKRRRPRARPSVVARRQIHRVLLGCIGRVHAALEGSEGRILRARSSSTPYPSFYYSPTWSPDSKKIAYADKRRGLFYIDISQEHPQAVKFVRKRIENFRRTRSMRVVAGQPLSRLLQRGSDLLTCDLRLRHARSTRYQITDGMSDATSCLR